MKGTFTALCVAMILLTVGLAVSDSSETVRLHGAASVVDRLINPHKAAVEKATGYTLVVVSSHAGKGLVDLVEGRCDASLASASLGLGRHDAFLFRDDPLHRACFARFVGIHCSKTSDKPSA